MSHAKLEVRMESLLPFLQGTCTPYNMPVYPGAQRIIADSLTDKSRAEFWTSEFWVSNRQSGSYGLLSR
jgi:hypothetical protein